MHKKTPELQTIEDGILILNPILQKTDLSTLLERRFTLRAYPYTAWLTWHRETGNIFFGEHAGGWSHEDSIFYNKSLHCKKG